MLNLLWRYSQIFAIVRDFILKICEYLNRRFNISYHSVAAMVGIIASRIGILHVMKNREGTHSVYQLKEQYTDLVAKIVGTT